MLDNQGIGQALHAARAGHELEALAYSAFCPAHVKVAGDENTDPDVAGPEPLPLPDEPYHPLIAFDSQDRGLFTGREDDTLRCAGLLDEAATRGLLLHGGGGVGKTSFLRAGLVPHLETEAVGYPPCAIAPLTKKLPKSMIIRWSRCGPAPISPVNSRRLCLRSAPAVRLPDAAR